MTDLCLMIDSLDMAERPERHIDRRTAFRWGITGVGGVLAGTAAYIRGARLYVGADGIAMRFDGQQAPPVGSSGALPVIDERTDPATASPTEALTPTPDPLVEIEQSFEKVNHASDGETVTIDSMRIQAFTRVNAGVLGTQHIAVAYHDTNAGRRPFALFVNAACLYDYANNNNLFEEQDSQQGVQSGAWRLKKPLKLDQVVVEVDRNLPEGNVGKFLDLKSYTLEGGSSVSCRPELDDVRTAMIEERFELGAIVQELKDVIK